MAERKKSGGGAPAVRLPLAKARAHWHRIQGLAAPGQGPLAEVVAATGWPRTLGGVDVYLALRARVPGLRRADLDRALLEARLQVIPAVRGCIYLVPRAEAPLCLRVAEEQWRKRADYDLRRVGVGWGEVEEVAAAALALLRKGPLSTDGIRKALPPGTVRSLGDKGKKVGLSSPLPPALRLLELDRKIERLPDGGRLDNERYEWRACKKTGGATAVPGKPEERLAALAHLFLRWAGPVSVADFAAWAALSQREARAALAAIASVPVAVEGYADEAFVLSEQLVDLQEGGRAQSLSLLSFEDNYLTVHGGPGVLAPPEQQGRKVGVWGGGKATTLGTAKHVAMRTVFDGDALAGFWEYDPDQDAVALATFRPLPPPRRRALEALAEGTATFLRDDMGHAKSFSLDTREAIKERALQVKAI